MLFLDAYEVQLSLANFLRQQRESAGLSRAALADLSLVPAPTIKKFELTGQISLRQFLLLWQSLDDLQRMHGLTLASMKLPTSIAEVLQDDL